MIDISSKMFYVIIPTKWNYFKIIIQNWIKKTCCVLLKQRERNYFVQYKILCGSIETCICDWNLRSKYTLDMLYVPVALNVINSKLLINLWSTTYNFIFQLIINSKISTENNREITKRNFSISLHSYINHSHEYIVS